MMFQYNRFANLALPNVSFGSTIRVELHAVIQWLVQWASSPKVLGSIPASDPDFLKSSEGIGKYILGTVT